MAQVHAQEIMALKAGVVTKKL